MYFDINFDLKGINYIIKKKGSYFYRFSFVKGKLEREV